MNGSGALGPGSGPGRRLVLLLLLLPALTGIWVAVRMAAVAVPFGASGEDALLTRLLGFEDSPAVRVRRLEAATAAAPLDFRYPYWLGISVWFDPDAEGRRWDRALRAREAFLSAADRCPDLAEARFYLFQVAASLGRVEEADAQARAVLALAPMQRSLTRAVQQWFGNRYRQTREDRDLVTCLQAGEPGDDYSVEMLSFPLLTFAETSRILALTELPLPRQVDLLERAGRYEWAIRYLGGTDEDGARDLAGRVRERYGSYLLARGSAKAAIQQFDAAREELADRFEALAARGAALVLTGRAKEGMESIADAVRAGASAGSVREALTTARVPAEERARFWGDRLGEAGPRATFRLEAGRAWGEAGDNQRAEAALRPLLDDPEVGAEANWCLARLLARAGSPAMARKYAARAVELAPENRAYARFLEALGKRPR